MDEVFVPLDIAQSAYYAHFIDCLMPKLVYVLELRKRAPRFYANLRVYMPGDKASENTYSILRHLNVTWTHQWPLNQRFKAIVWVCHTPPISPPQGAAIIRAVQLDAIDGGAPPPRRAKHEQEQPRRSCSGAVAYAARPKGVTDNGRNLRDEDGVVKALEARGRGVVRVITGKEPVDELRRTLGDACYLVGEHGTGLTNMIFLPPDASVVEMDGWSKYTVMWTMANAFGLRYAWLKHDREEVDAGQLILLFDAIEKTSRRFD